ncbi:hypothetical protein BuS5_02933 [Desulfosarcina sp. BuS5]|nr:hypothetical protein BuS5_02933 [Desulfosarcina sp. BuS5]
MPVALRSLRPGRPIFIRSVVASRIAGYAIRMSGGVGGGSREATPYPYRRKCPMSRADPIACSELYNRMLLRISLVKTLLAIYGDMLLHLGHVLLELDDSAFAQEFYRTQIGCLFCFCETLSNHVDRNSYPIYSSLTFMGVNAANQPRSIFASAALALLGHILRIRFYFF